MSLLYPRSSKFFFEGPLIALFCINGETTYVFLLIINFSFKFWIERIGPIDSIGFEGPMTILSASSIAMATSDVISAFSEPDPI